MAKPRGRVSERQKKLLLVLAKAELFRPGAAGYNIAWNDVDMADRLVTRGILTSPRPNSYKLVPTYAGPYMQEAMRQKMMAKGLAQQLYPLQSHLTRCGHLNVQEYIRQAETGNGPDLADLKQNLILWMENASRAIKQCQKTIDNLAANEPTLEEINAELVYKKLGTT